MSLLSTVWIRMLTLNIRMMQSGEWEGKCRWCYKEVLSEKEMKRIPKLDLDVASNGWVSARPCSEKKTRGGCWYNESST